MSRTPEDTIAIQIQQQENCRVSYILNYEQPVRCSIIGDSPLFFMDYEDDIDDIDEIEGFFGFGAIENGLTTIEERLVSGCIAEEEDSFVQADKIALFCEDKTFMTEKRETAQTAQRPAKLMAVLEKSRLAKSFIEFAALHKVSFSYSRQVENACYDRNAGEVLINPDRPETEQILSTSRELRRVWQHKNGALLHPLTFLPDQAVLVNRAQIADITASMVRIAWELQLSEERIAWEWLENSSYADLAHALARECYLDFRTLNNGVAGSAVFESWFLSERCQHEDRKLIRLMLADYRGYVFDAEQSSRQITADLILALGRMPFGKNYLAPYVQTIMADPVFTEVRDRSNANFLWFIKFERSFRETEQELQTDEDNICHGNSPDGSNNKKRFDDNEEKQNIVFLPHGGKPGTDTQRTAAGGKVVYLRDRPVK